MAEQNEKALAEAQERIKQLEKINLELTDRLQAAETAEKIELPVVKIGSKNYKVMHGVRHQRRDYSAAQIAEDKKLAGMLLENGSSAIQMVESKKG
jgi:cAMP phosphodiesterase